ncbi:hypothetical protein ZEAMMB73_Zm00001d051408 [Zea mays]|uniref:Uncharacterized protein n=1 Tax=Zea mays TaxID=4577 RepID=A0A1D6Q6R5_MAIZE|nr:hypothetical protein ZEAMMB73_Zm00001d051408 [Zea mays]
MIRLFAVFHGCNCDHGSRCPSFSTRSSRLPNCLTIFSSFFAGSSSRDETFFETTPWLESDCEDDFYSVNGDLTPAGSFASRTSGRNTPPPRPRDLLTLAAILKAEPLKPPPPQRRLGDLLREAQDDDNDTTVDGLSRDDSLRMGAEANRCCVPQLAWAISCNGRTQRNEVLIRALFNRQEKICRPNVYVHRPNDCTRTVKRKTFMFCMQCTIT